MVGHVKGYGNGGALNCGGLLLELTRPGVWEHCRDDGWQFRYYYCPGVHADLAEAVPPETVRADSGVLRRTVRSLSEAAAFFAAIGG